jgi:signal transduction histidine kinase
VLWSVGLVLGLLLVAGVIAYRHLRHTVALERERARLAAISAERDAGLDAAPTARYLFRAVGGESFIPGALATLGPPDQDFAALCRRFGPGSSTAIEIAVTKLRQEGASFDLHATLVEGNAAFDISGRRLLSPTGQILGDAIWFSDAAERAAAERERDGLRALIDALPFPIWRRRASDLGLVDCNHAYTAAVDAPPESLIADKRELAGSAAGKVLADKARQAGVAIENRHVVINGSRRWLELAEIRLGAANSPGGELVGFARDQTDLEGAQSELQRHIAAHATVLEHIAVAIAIYGPDRRLTFFNTAFALLWQLEGDWLSTHPLIEEVMDRLRERRRLPEVADFRAFRRHLLLQFTSLIAPHEELMHLPDERTLRLVVSPHPFGGLTFAYEDVTDRLALERSYNTLIQVQRETLDHLYEGIAVFGSDGRLKLWNPAYAKLWDLPPENLGGEPHVAEITEKMRGFFDEGQDWPGLKARIIARLTADTAGNTRRLERRDGSVLQAVTVPLPDGNVLLSYLDTTDSTRVEHALRERNEALETAGRLKSEFIANVSYELRTPLNAIIGFTEILAHQYFGELNPRQADYAQSILESSNQLLSLINDILDLATIEAGYMEIDREPVDILGLMSGVMTFARERARAQGLRLEFDCPSDIGTVPGDERRLKQAIFNLVSNALKFTPHGGTVTLAARRAGDRVALVVSDTGVGVAEHDQQRIFEKFERGSSQARQTGAGLGLSLVKSLIELHGGVVELQSHPGHGTSVTCWLKADAPAREDIRATA